MKYTIAEAETAPGLEVEVNRLIDEGWIPIGGMAAMTELIGLAPGKLDKKTYLSRIKFLFYQAMIYRSASENPEASG